MTDMPDEFEPHLREKLRDPEFRRLYEQAQPEMEDEDEL